MLSKRIHRTILISIIVILNFSVDQITKSIVRNNIETNETIGFLNNTLILKKAENTGAAFGIGGNMPSDIKTIYFQILPLIFLVYLFRMIIVDKDITKTTAIGIAFAIGGGIGNIFDRIFYGSVTDFIILKINTLETGIFNLADVSIIVGIILVFWEIITHSKESQNTIN